MKLRILVSSKKIKMKLRMKILSFY